MVTKRSPSLNKPLLSVAEVALLLGRDRSTLYDAIKEGTFPLPIVRLRKQIFIPRAYVERLLGGKDSSNGSENSHCSKCGKHLAS
jgi:excisionase family DNA binding protein